MKTFQRYLSSKNKDFRSKDVLVHLMCAVGNDEWTGKRAYYRYASFRFFALLFCFVFVPYNKQLTNLDRSVVTGKSRPTVLTSLPLGQLGEA